MSAPDGPLAPLAGLRVLELATLYAAPQIGAMLGDLGADVVKVEAPAGDPMRHMGVQRDGVSPNWSWVGRNKRSVALDLDADDDQRVFRQLAGVAGVLIENLPPTLRTRWDVGYDTLHELNANLVVVSVSCYGLTGPYADRPGAGTLAEAFAGLTALTGEADGPPMLSSVPLGDTLTAFWGVIGALAACWAQARHGAGGRLVDVAMYEPILAVLGGTIAGYDPEDPPIRTGSRVRGGAPRNVYRARDGAYVAVSGTTDAQVARLLPLLGRDTEADRERFGSATDRLRHADELDRVVEGWIGGQDLDATLAALLDARIPVAPVNEIGALLDDEHLQARGSLTPIRAPNTAPKLDADRVGVLRDWLGA